MHKLIFCLVLFISLRAVAQHIDTRFETSKGTQTPDYFEIIKWWEKLDQRSGKVKMLTMGMTDAGYPLHLVVLSNNGDHIFDKIHKNDKRVILINNGIHPGEPDGIDASMLLAKDIVANTVQIPDNIILAIIPVYNIGGCLNRSAFYRVDQDGPEEFGSRGNSQNLDLNRDFIKCDSREARSFTEIFHLTDPDVFIDNHVSNGADYQHVMTLLTTQSKKLGPVMGHFLEKEFEPAIYTSMKGKGYDLVPYVNAFGETPENGWPEFWDSPRYGSGYAALWHTFSFVPETHMLKPYPERVKATYALMQSFISFTSANSITIKNLRNQSKQQERTAASFALAWTLDRKVYKTVTYKGYESGKKTSLVSGQPRLYYDRSNPFQKTINIFNNYVASSSVTKPKAYIVPQGWWKVIELLRLNKVSMSQLKKDTSIEVEVYQIDDFKTSPRQYEGHHVNNEVKVSSSIQKVNCRKGDWYIALNQLSNRFLMATLEPQAEDSYFAWNFFDAILGQKEGYSAYVFEDIAANWLKTDTRLRSMLEEKRASDTAFAKNGAAQLNFVYRNSQYAEPSYMRYPVYRVLK